MIKLFGDEDEEVPTPKLEEALRNAIRATRLVENSDFQWWRENYLALAVERAGEQLDKLVDDPNRSNVARGIRKGIRGALKGLEVLSARREFLEEKLNERRNDQPVTREVGKAV